MRTALVTGATGHLGANLVRELLERGWSVHAFVRVTSDLAGLRGQDVELHYGDLLDRPSLDRAMEGIDVVFHAGAVYKNWTPDDDDMLRPAIEGTENVLRAAAAANIRRVVYTSSANAVGFTSDPSRPLDESTWNTELYLPYVRAKVHAECRAWDLAEALDIELIAMLPTGILGPHDHRLTPTSKYARDVLAGEGPVLSGTTNLVHVRDVAIAHVLAAEKGRPGERYLVGGPNISDMHLADLVAQRTGKRPTILAAPRFLLMGLAWLLETVAGIRGTEPLLTTALIRTAHGRHVCFDTSKARNELGFEARGPEAVLDDTAAWLVRSGHLAPRLDPVPA